YFIKRPCSFGDDFGNFQDDKFSRQFNGLGYVALSYRFYQIGNLLALSEPRNKGIPFGYKTGLDRQTAVVSLLFKAALFSKVSEIICVLGLFVHCCHGIGYNISAKNRELNLCSFFILFFNDIDGAVFL